MVRWLDDFFIICSLQPYLLQGGLNHFSKCPLWVFTFSSRVVRRVLFYIFTVTFPIVALQLLISNVPFELPSGCCLLIGPDRYSIILLLWSFRRKILFSAVYAEIVRSEWSCCLQLTQMVQQYICTCIDLSI